MRNDFCVQANQTHYISNFTIYKYLKVLVSSLKDKRIDSCLVSLVKFLVIWSSLRILLQSEKKKCLYLN